MNEVFKLWFLNASDSEGIVECEYIADSRVSMDERDVDKSALYADGEAFADLIGGNSPSDFFDGMCDRFVALRAVALGVD